MNEPRFQLMNKVVYILDTDKAKGVITHGPFYPGVTVVGGASKNNYSYVVQFEDVALLINEDALKLVEPQEQEQWERCYGQHRYLDTAHSLNGGAVERRVKPNVD